MKLDYGIAGMAERVWATGGEMKMTNRIGGGVTLDVWVPASSTTVDETSRFPVDNTGFSRS